MSHETELPVAEKVVEEVGTLPTYTMIDHVGEDVG